jgi:4-hydroxy-tetrahydrodipicolinate reductase
MVKVLVNGYKGKMGSTSVEAILKDPNLELVGKTDELDNLEEEIYNSQAQVVVDFTHASVAYDNASKIIKSNACPVIGTSGFLQKEVSELQKLCKEKELGGIIAPNFAIGAVLMMKFAKEAVAYMPNVEIIEIHHDEKLDSPSGTAVRTAELLCESSDNISSVKMLKETLKGARGAELQGVNIHSIRLPGVIANQKVIFGGKGQTLTIEHNSLNRDSFMDGVCLACNKAVHLNKLYYGLECIL